jgi:PP-loop superfamily ATP-utilizing enzyme
VEIPKLLANETFTRVAEALKQIGYAHVTLDLLGYRRGSLNKKPVSGSGHMETNKPRIE